MTVALAVETALLTAIRAQIPTVQVADGPQAEDTALREAVWVESSESEFEWRSIGGPALATRNRSELVRVELRVHVYRESGDQTDASTTAKARAHELLAEIEDAFEADFSLGGTATHALITRWIVTAIPRESGWAIDGRATVEVTNYPT